MTSNGETASLFCDFVILSKFANLPSVSNIESILLARIIVANPFKSITE